MSLIDKQDSRTLNKSLEYWQQGINWEIISTTTLWNILIKRSTWTIL